MAERKPGFIYIYSEILKQEIAMSEKTGIVYCQDGVTYSPDEVAILGKNGGEIPLQVHIVKKVFEKSEVVEYAGHESNAAGMASHEPEEADVGKKENNIGNSGGKVACASGNGKENESGELDIY